MNTPPPEKRRIKISTGTTPAPKIASLAACHPFSQQLDIVFPSNPTLFEALRGLETVYAKGKVKLGDVVNNADVFTNPINPWIACTNPCEDNEDVWCIDPCSHLTLSISVNTYEQLGLVGQRLPFKNQHDRHVIDIPLQKNAQSVVNVAKQNKALEEWDARRENELGRGNGLWNVLFYSNDLSSLKIPVQGAEQRRVRCTAREFNDLVVPIPTLRPRPDNPSNQRQKSKTSSAEREEAQEDWDIQTQSLFEWVGMACLGAQRLLANDRVDPFVAVYEHPEPSTVQNVTHLRWSGLLSPTFIKQVIDTILSTLQGPVPTSTPAPFVAVTCQTLSSSPVSYIPYTVSATGGLQIPASVPPKLPRSDGEDCWSLIIARPNDPSISSPNSDVLNWCLAESIGQWDGRWG